MMEKIRSKYAGGNEFSFLTNHAFVLIQIARSPRATLREIARKTGVTERTVYKIVRDLEAADYIVKHRDGRRNSYSLNENVLLGHHLTGELTVSQLVDAMKRLATAPEARRELGDESLAS
jgi:DNA-binding IclR family transcriptional regulator